MLKGNVQVEIYNYRRETQEQRLERQVCDRKGRCRGRRVVFPQEVETQH